MSNILDLGRAKYPRQFYGECQRCQRIDYLPFATEHGVRYCAHCWEKDAIEHVELLTEGRRLAAAVEPTTRSVVYDMRHPSKPDYTDAMTVIVRRRSILERMQAIACLLFSNWRAV